jgi:hypothetical protein
MRPGNDHLGPLPGSGQTAQLQQISLAQLNCALPADQFIFHQTTSDDNGVDGMLELRSESYATNMQAHLQVKATERATMNKDQSIHFQVKTANLNYLLNGTSSLYILYVNETRELFYCWAQDEQHRIETEKPNWRSQTTVTLHFAQKLAGASLDLIYERIINEARLKRHISDILSRSSAGPVMFSVDPTTLTSTDPHKLYKLVADGGLSAVGLGYSKEVLQAIDHLNPGQRSDPAILVAKIYANFELSRYDAAQATVSEAMLKRDDLTEELQQFVLCLSDACSYHCGLFDVDEYQRRLDSYASETSAFGLSCRLEQLRYALLDVADGDSRTDMVSQIREVVTSIQCCPTAGEVLKLQAKIVQLHAEGKELVFEFLENEAVVRIRTSMGQPSEAEALAESYRQSLQFWNERMSEATARANELVCPIALADALSTTSMINYALLANMRLSAAVGRPNAYSDELVYATMHLADEALKIYVTVGNIESESRAKLLLAELFGLLGQEEASKRLATDILPRARAMKYERIAADAQLILSGNNLLKRSIENISFASSADEDYVFSKETDDRLRGAASRFIKAWNIPSDRLDVVHRDLMAQREMAGERMNWCRHLEMNQETLHEQSPTTKYKTDPKRKCECTLYGYRSAIGCVDVSAVIRAFKAAYCENCSSQSPKELNVSQ